MNAAIETIDGGTVTTPAGFHAGATAAGIKGTGGEEPDLGILFSETPCSAAGVFTTSRIRSAPVRLSSRHLQDGRAQAVVVNSGCANSSTGQKGLADAAEMAALVARDLGIAPEDVLVASTGVIGWYLPMERIAAGLRCISLSPAGGHDLARAMMTTDTRPKEAAVRATAAGTGFSIGGVAKGSGMIHPEMATMLAFLTTDAAVEPGFLRAALRRAASLSFNMVTVDGETSPSDTVFLLANGLAGNGPITAASPAAAPFQQALERVCVALAKMIARDGEGASRLIEVTVSGAASQQDAVSGARAIAGSPLWKAAVYGRDPNWGRIVAALGYSGAEVEEERLDISLAGVPVLGGGVPRPFDREELSRRLSAGEVTISVNLNLGEASATAWGCDLTEEYVAINSHYTT